MQNQNEAVCWDKSRKNVICSISEVPESYLSSQSRIRAIEKFFKLSDDLVESNQSRVTTTVEPLQVIGMQVRVNVESTKSNIFPVFFAKKPNELQSGAQKLKYGSQCCFSDILISC